VKLRALRQQARRKQGELEVARLQLDRVDRDHAVLHHYRLPADMATAVYDVALSEGDRSRPGVPSVKVESASIRAHQSCRRGGAHAGAAEHGRLYDRA